MEGFLRASLTLPVPQWQIQRCNLRGIELLLSNADCSLSNLDDGRCAIDINHMQVVVHDAATNCEISVAVKSVLDKCVFKEDVRQRYKTPVGRYMGHVGQYVVHHLLEEAFLQLTRCSLRQTWWTQCQNLFLQTECTMCFIFRLQQRNKLLQVAGNSTS